MPQENTSRLRSQRHEPAWNKGRVIGSKPPLKPKQVWAVRFHLQREQRIRDLVRLRIGDVISGGEVRQRAIIVQQKTGRPVQFEITDTARDSVLAWLKRRNGSVDDYLLPSRVDRDGHITTRQYARLVDEWLAAVGLNPASYGTHSLRRPMCR